MTLDQSPEDPGSALQAAVLADAYIRLTAGKFFSTCYLRDIASLRGLSHRLQGADFEALRLMHCRDWDSMSPDLAELVRAKCREFLDIPEPRP